MFDGCLLHVLAQGVMGQASEALCVLSESKLHGAGAYMYLLVVAIHAPCNRIWSTVVTCVAAWRCLQGVCGREGPECTGICTQEGLLALPGTCVLHQALQLLYRYDSLWLES